LRQIFIRRADDHAIHARVARGNRGGGRKCIVRLELDHRPDHHTRRGEGFFEQIELSQKIGSMPSPVLCTPATVRCGKTR